MPLTFTFALSQQQTFELRCDYGSRSLDKAELLVLIDLCEENYYSQKSDRPSLLLHIGRQLYQWIDGKQGWLRRALDEAEEQTIYLNLIQTSEAQGLNPETERVALGLAHLPWELLHDGTGFLLERQDIAVLPVRSVQQRHTNVAGVQNRPLRLLFMATSPEDIEPVLDYEREETNILQATKDQPLALIVEESGSVQELTNLVKSYEEDYFDVFHLTGHGIIYTQEYFGGLLPKGRKIKDYTPCFITEDEVGNVQLTTVEDLAKAFRGRFPRVIFLSGCHTGQVANRGTVPSMAQALVKMGAGVVLGWARPVYDRTGIIAAQTFYQALATGETVEGAVKAAQQEMIAKERPDWHLLRIYRDTRQIEQLVTPLRTKKREKLKFTQPESEFLDENNIVKVASRWEFVGRRRPLQRCLQALRETSDNIGVFIAGMGGLGKSSLAARLCTRVQTQRPNFERVVLIGPLDEVGLLNKLSSKFERFADVPALLNEPKVSLKGRLQNFFDRIEAEEIDRPLLLVLDDFEQNIPKANIEDGSLRMTAEAYRILEAICAALEENAAQSRLIVTCRYLKEDTLPPHQLHLESLAAMNSADVDKICRELDKEVKQQVDEQRITRIADGNPRLLRWLLDVVKQPGLESDELLTRLENTQQEFRENILAQTLLSGLEDGEKKFLARLSVFHLPVTEDVVRAISSNAWDSKSQANSESPLKRTEDLAEGISSPLERTWTKAVEIDFLAVMPKLLSLSLVESATTHATQTAEYRVTTILEFLLEPLLSEEEWLTTRQQAARKIYQVWWEESEKNTEEQGLEIVRLGLLAGEQEIAVSVGDSIADRWVNSSRFLEAVQLCDQLLQKFVDYRILGTIARAEEVLGRVEDAVAYYQQALDLCPEADLENKATTLNNMALVIAKQGDISGAIALWQQSLEISERIGNVGGKGAILNNMAQVIAQQGDISEAIALWQQSLEISERIGNVGGKGAILNNMAQVIAQQGDISEAIALWQQSLEIKEHIGDVGAKAATLSNMAGVIAQQGDISRAIALWQQSLEIKERIGDVGGKATTLSNMAGVIAQQGDIFGALALWQQSLEIKERIGDVGGKAATLRNMAGVIAQQGDISEAIALWQQSLETYEWIGDISGKAATLNNMALVVAQRGDIQEAITLWQQSLETYERIGDVRGKATTLGNLAYWAGETGDKARELDLNLQAASAFAQVRAYGDLVRVLSNLGLTADESNGLVYLAQATWLTLRIQAPLADTIYLMHALYNRVPEGDELEALLGTTALFFCSRRGEGHPQLEELQERSFEILLGAAGAQGIKTQEAFDTWYVQQRLNDPEYFLSRLNQRLEEIVGDGWLFERS
ncbi:MAG: tetratricopeptide repeat protein [Brasilonema octagenarum HA4186-MV1]|jgi:tetratricopeptide (TPR) repeat protein|nr:tetratricopeptide repeat protein [Brasilonema octagenarum HA4186-MV1]